MVQQFGYGRAFHILAITVCQADWDRRYSPDNRAWANALSIPANPDAWGTDRNCYLAVSSHPGLVDLFLSQTRKAYAQELCCIPATEKGRMRLLCKQEGILAGIEIAQLVLRRLDPDMQFEQILRDGDRVKPGDVAFYVSGRLQSLLQAERILLNIMQRMSGVATQTAVYANKIKDLHTKVLDTRKTTPGMRVLDKMAVKIGGGENHRMGLFEIGRASCRERVCLYV